MTVGVGVDIKGNAKDLSNALGDATKSVHAFGKTLDTGISTGKFDAATDAIRKVHKVTSKAIKAGKDAAAAEQQFALSLEAAGVSAAVYEDELNAAIRSSQKLAFTDDETRNAIAALTTATHDAGTSIALLSTAQDVARLSGSSLEASADAVAKAFIGNDAALARMIPGLEQGATGFDTIAAASKAAEGQSEAFSKSASAGSAKTKIAMEELGEAIGGLLLPVVQGLFEALTPLLEAFADLVNELLPILVPLIEKLARVAEIAAKAIGKIASAVANLIGKIKELLGPLREAVDGLKNLDLNPFSGKAAPAPAGVAGVSGLQTTTTQSSGGRGGGVTINIYGDPSVIEARVTKALRDYARRNGVGSVFTPGRS
jgi:hypothetical protein